MALEFLDEDEACQMELAVPLWQTQEIETKVDETLAELEYIYGRDLIDPSLHYDLTGVVGGRARKKNGKYSIHLNREVMKDSRNWDEFINQTVPHEVAHIAQYQIYPGSAGHGKEWKEIMQNLGLPANRCHTHIVKRKRHARPYAYACQCKTHNVTANRHGRIQRGSRYYCNSCHTEIAEI